MTDLLYEPVLHGVAAQLHVGSPEPGVQSGLGNLHGLFLVLDGLLQQLNVLLHVEDLLEDLSGETFSQIELIFFYTYKFLFYK